MIRYVHHEAIDQALWDKRLEACTNKLWYARSRVLDIASPGWDALVDEERGALMPLTQRRKWGIRYLTNPYGLQQLGVFAEKLDAKLVDEFLRAIPVHFRHADIWLASERAPSQMRHALSSPQVNQTLLTNADAATLQAAYAKGHVRNLRSSPTPVIDHDLSAAEFTTLFERTTGARFGGSPKGSIPVLTALIADALNEGTGRIHCIRVDGSPAAATCFINWAGRSILLKSANDERGWDRKAMFHIVHQWITEHAGTGHLLDFAGSNTPSVARFNAGFGAAPSTYFRFRLNRLPWPLRLLKP